MEDDALYPNPADIVRTTAKQLNEEHPEVSDDEVWATLTTCEGYQKALKPYLISRIEQIKSMSEVDFNGKESVEEVGIRYLIFSLVGKELQELLTKIEVTSKIVNHYKKEDAT
jgi:hypothetical protein